jgi:hypothetical protein
VIGLIDGTLIRLNATPPGPEGGRFRCRKGYPALNALCIVDYRGRFSYVNCRWPGSAHDAFILQSGEVWRAFENPHPGEAIGPNYSILGDSGFALKPWCMTPFRNVRLSSDVLFN